MEELVAQGAAWIRAVEAAVEGMPDGPTKTRLTRHAALVHRQMELMHDIAAEGGVVQTRDGTDKPPPKP